MLILFDSDARNHLLPLTATRPMAELRLGASTLREKWERALGTTEVSYVTREHLQGKYPVRIEEDNLMVNAGVLPNAELVRQIRGLGMHEALIADGELIAARLTEAQIEALVEDEEVRELQAIELPADLPITRITRLWHLIQHNDAELRNDLPALRGNRRSLSISATNQVLGAENIFLEEGVKMECCILNATNGPIYLGKNVEVMEGSILRGPLFIGEDSIVKMGAKIYGGTSIGPGCRIGGEVSRSILIGNSNKGHEGYLGDSVLGEWCNLGADTNTSNLKNNYSEVKLWDYATERFERTGLQFCGLTMGDHAKAGINTMFNTGTVVGVFANVFGAGYPRNFIPDFSWGGADAGYRSYKITEARDTAKAVFERRGLPFTEQDEAILQHIFERTAQWRTWEK